MDKKDDKWLKHTQHDHKVLKNHQKETQMYNKWTKSPRTVRK